MKRNFLLALVAVFGLSLGACQKQPSDAERNAEIERQVQERLKAEHQAEEQTKLAQRQAELDAREKAAADREDQLAATATPSAPAAATPESSAEDNEAESSSYATFYRKLDPYGDWMETGDYGYVFQPRQAIQSRDWRPYTNGHWIYTDAGWTWISDEPFGWATYHYGRWIRLRSFGWVWVPGEQWAPAWVSWRKGNSYVGWAPLPPEAQFDRQTGIRNWADSYYDIGPEHYTFVPAKQFGAKVSAAVILPPEHNVTIINQTINVTNITYNNSVVVDQGPSYDELRAQSTQPIERFRLERSQDLVNERPTFHGDVVTLPALKFRSAAQVSQPPRISRTVPQTVVENGWSGIKDQQAAQKARDKIKAEATPPPNAPPKKFVRPQGQISQPRPAPTVTPVPNPSVKPQPAPPRPIAATPTPNETAVPARTPRPRATNRPPLTPAPSASAEDNASTTPADRNQPPTATTSQQERRRQRQEAQAQRRAEREQTMEQRRKQTSERPEPSPTASPTANEQAAASSLPSPDAAASPASSPAPANERAAQRRERRAERKARRTNPDISPSPSPRSP